MILVWQSNYFQLKTTDIDFALGIYGRQYFVNTNNVGKIPFTGSPNEEIISRIKLNAIKNTKSFQKVIGQKEDRPYTTLSFKVTGKLWDKADREKMRDIDKELCLVKIQELKSLGLPTKTTWQFPLSFALDTEGVSSVLSKYDIELT